MGLFDNWPYTDFHRLNLDWVIKTVKSLEGSFSGIMTRLLNVESEAHNLHGEVADITAELDNLTAEDVGAIPLSGSTQITGPLQTTGDITARWLTAEWLRTSTAQRRSVKPDKYAVLDDNGWIYFRTLGDMLTDIGMRKVTASGWTAMQDPYGNVTAHRTFAVASPNVQEFPDVFWYAEANISIASLGLSTLRNVQCTIEASDSWEGCKLGTLTKNNLQVYAMANYAIRPSSGFTLHLTVTGTK